MWLFLGCNSGIRLLPHNFALKASRFLRNDSRCMRVMASRNMSQSATQENALDWVKQDKRRMLHVVYRVGDLDKSIKYVTSKMN
jgi:lactoylglutathione lyase